MSDQGHQSFVHRLFADDHYNKFERVRIHYTKIEHIDTISLRKNRLYYIINIIYYRKNANARFTRTTREIVYESMNEFPISSHGDGVEFRR